VIGFQAPDALLAADLVEVCPGQDRPDCLDALALLLDPRDDGEVDAEIRGRRLAGPAGRDVVDLEVVGPEVLAVVPCPLGGQLLELQGVPGQALAVVLEVVQDPGEAVDHLEEPDGRGVVVAEVPRGMYLVGRGMVNLCDPALCLGRLHELAVVGAQGCRAEAAVVLLLDQALVHALPAVCLHVLLGQGTGVVNGEHLGVPGGI